MSLHYRGVTYDRSPAALETTESEVVEHYRGATYKMRKPVNAPDQHPGIRLKYRGAWVQ
ncbi:MAG TPA: DUF4278 domain-containing protein [Elainellaceae cyanobacterium]